MFVLNFLFITTIFIVVFFKIKYRRQNYLLSKIPSPKKLPIVHNGLELFGATPEKIFSWIEEKFKELGPVYYFAVGPFDPGYAVIADVKVVEAILTSRVSLDKPSNFDSFIPWLGTGLLTSKGKKWFQRRKLLTSAFQFQNFEKFVNIFNEQATVFVQKLAKYDRKDVDIAPLLKLFTLDTVCEAVMGINICAQTTDCEYLNAVNEIADIMVLRALDPVKSNKFLFKFTEMYKREQECLKVVHDFSDGVIKMRKKELLKNNGQVTKKKRKALLDILLSSTIDGQPLSDSDIREEVDTFMHAGYDTVSTTIGFALYNIAKYPDVQQNVYEEVIKVLGADEDFTLSKVNELKYLDLVIKESMRLFPTAPYFGRQLSEDLSANGYTFPKGMNMYIAPYLLRHNSELFDNPEEFNPYRFDVEMGSNKINPFAHIPFSAGPRNCIGQKFAQHEMKIIISKIVKMFKLKLSVGQEKLVLTNKIVLRSVNGINIYLEKRN